MEHKGKEMGMKGKKSHCIESEMKEMPMMKMMDVDMQEGHAAMKKKGK